MPVEHEPAAVEAASAYLAAVKGGQTTSIGDYAAKGGLDTASTTIAGFLGASSDDVVTARALSQAELYWYFANHHPWIGAGTSLIAQTIAGAGYDIVAPGADRDQDAVDSDPIVIALRMLLDQVNEQQSIEDLVEEIALDRDVVGKFYVHILRLPSTGKMVGLERLDSRTTAPVLADDGRSIRAYIQKTRVGTRVITTTYATEDVIFGKRAGGADLLGRGSPIEQIDLTLGIDWAARRAEAAKFRNGLRAGAVLVNKTISKDQLEHNKKEIELTRTGVDNAQRPLMLGGDWDIKFPPAQDEENGASQDRARQEVCATYHIPESKLMTITGALGGNGKESDDQTFHEECVMPRARYIWRTISRAIMREFGITNLAIQPKAKYSIRLSAIPFAVQMLQAGATISEARAIAELPKLARTDLDLDMPLVGGLLKAARNVLAPPAQPLALPAAAAVTPDGQPPEEVAQKGGARFRHAREGHAHPRY
jgi:HK97 family phage portal protein